MRCQRPTGIAGARACPRRAVFVAAQAQGTPNAAKAQPAVGPIDPSSRLVVPGASAGPIRLGPGGGVERTTRRGVLGNAALAGLASAAPPITVPSAVSAVSAALQV
jgi:hypothetical protein